jgi:hypothetical protein
MKKTCIDHSKNIACKSPTLSFGVFGADTDSTQDARFEQEEGVWCPTSLFNIQLTGAAMSAIKILNIAETTVAAQSPVH